MRVIVAQDPARAGESVLAELAGLLILTQLPQGGGELVGRAQGVGVVVAQDRRVRVRASSPSWRASSYCPNSRRAAARARAAHQGMRVVVAQDPARAGEGVLGELAGLLILPQLPQGGGELVGRAQGVGVVVAQDSPHAGEGVLTELARLLVLPQLTQVDGDE